MYNSLLTTSSKALFLSFAGTHKKQKKHTHTTQNITYGYHVSILEPKMTMTIKLLAAIWNLEILMQSFFELLRVFDDDQHEKEVGMVL